MLLNGIEVKDKLYEGIGPLIVRTPRGDELKAHNGDHIYTFPDGSISIVTADTHRKLSNPDAEVETEGDAGLSEDEKRYERVKNEIITKIESGNVPPPEQMLKGLDLPSTGSAPATQPPTSPAASGGALTGAGGSSVDDAFKI